MDKIYYILSLKDEAGKDTLSAIRRNKWNSFPVLIKALNLVFDPLSQ